jgi:hypothetical protein
MWWWFVIWAIIIWLLFSGGGYYGYRYSYYGLNAAIGFLIVVFVVFWVVLIFAGPYWGYYRWWW